MSIRRPLIAACCALMALASSAQAGGASAKGGSFGGKSGSVSSGSATTGSAAIGRRRRRPDPKLVTFASHKELVGAKTPPPGTTNGGNGNGVSGGTGTDAGVPTGFGRPLKAKRPSVLAPLSSR
jgi:hypothetical protein